MRVRRIDPVTGDYQWGHGNVDYLVNEPAAVGQLAYTRLNLILGEWFANATQGLNISNILGPNSQATYDLAYRDCISETQGFADFASYSSYRDPNSRALSVQATIYTVYNASIGAPGLVPNQVTVTNTVTI